MKSTCISFDTTDESAIYIVTHCVKYVYVESMACKIWNMPDKRLMF